MPALREFKGAAIHSNQYGFYVPSFYVTGTPRAAGLTAIVQVAVRETLPQKGWKRCGSCGEYIKSGLECEASVTTAPSICDAER